MIGHVVGPTAWGSELECIDHVDGLRIDIDALPGEDAVEIVEIKARHELLEQRRALENLALQALNMAPRRERLAMSVLLITWYTSCSASRALWMFGITLSRKRKCQATAG